MTKINSIKKDIKNSDKMTGLNNKYDEVVYKSDRSYFDYINEIKRNDTNDSHDLAAAFMLF